MPRTTLTATMTASEPPDNSARAGTPSSSTPAMSRAQYPYRRIRVGAASSAATVPSRSTLVTSPAPALPAPTAAAYSGVTESSR